MPVASLLCLLLARPRSPHAGGTTPVGERVSHGNNLRFNRQQIYEMNPDGTGITRITRNNDNNIGPDWESGRAARRAPPLKPNTAWKPDLLATAASCR
jgi:hypothetical protein